MNRKVLGGALFFGICTAMVFLISRGQIEREEERVVCYAHQKNCERKENELVVGVIYFLYYSIF